MMMSKRDRRDLSIERLTDANVEARRESLEIAREIFESSQIARRHYEPIIAQLDSFTTEFDEIDLAKALRALYEAGCLSDCSRATADLIYDLPR